jgi:OmcA/MtrC family decaheme c-type cytochrome
VAVSLAAVLGGCADQRPIEDQSSVPPPGPDSGAGPGLRLAVEGATVTPDRRVQVTYRLTDDQGQPRTRDGIENRWTLAALSIDPETVGNTVPLPAWQSYILVPAQAPHADFQQPGSELEPTTGPGAAEDLGGGRFRYTITRAIPEGQFNGALTHRVGVYSRLLVSAGPPQQFHPDQPSVVFDFVPNGGAVTQRDVVIAENCNQCHGEVRAHGGFRRGVDLCKTCHTPQLRDPDTKDPNELEGTNLTNETANRLDFPRLVHRIHRGRDLPTLARAADGTPVPGRQFAVVGFGGPEVFGQVVQRTENGAGPTTVRQGVAFPRDIRDCAVCHANAPQASEATAAPSRRVCLSCHADLRVDGSSDEFHKPHPIALSTPGSDNGCRGCHNGGGAGPEFSQRVADAHVVPTRSRQLPGLTFKILGVSVDPATRTPTVTFDVRSGADTDDPAAFAQLPPVAMPAARPAAGAQVAVGELNTLALTLSGPTAPDFSATSIVQEDVRFTGPDPGAPGRQRNEAGVYTYTFSGALPQGATGTWAVSMEGRRQQALQNPQRRTVNGSQQDSVETILVQESATNPVVYFDPASGSTSGVTPRRQVVDTATKCNVCHGDLRLHGDLRRSTAYCVMCHAPDNTDWDRRPKTGTGAGARVNLAATHDAVEERSIHFKRLIHRIHTGENLVLTRPFVIYGFGGTPNFFDEVRFPADIRRCNICHVGQSWAIESIPASASPTVANETGNLLHTGSNAPVPEEPRLPPIQATCLACHDHDNPTNAPGQPTLLAHVRQYTFAGGGEGCATCHGQHGDQDIRRFHLMDR